MRSDQIKNKGAWHDCRQIRSSSSSSASPSRQRKIFHTWGSRTANILMERSPSGSTCARVSFRCPWVTFKRCAKFRRLLQTKLTFLCRPCSITVLQTSDPSFVYLEQNSTHHIPARALCPLRCLCFSAPCFFFFFSVLSLHCETPWAFIIIFFCPVNSLHSGCASKFTHL